MSDQRFPKIYRLCTSAQFDVVFQHRCSLANAQMVMYCKENYLPYPRIGLVVSRKVGNAVKRNRWKRLLREAFRRQRTELPQGFDFVVIPRGNIEPEFQNLAEAMLQLTIRLALKSNKEDFKRGK